MTYGYSASVSWTVSFFSTFFEEVVIIQPLKVTTWAALFSVLFESDVGPATPADYYVNLGRWKNIFSAYICIRSISTSRLFHLGRHPGTFDTGNDVN